MTTDIKTLLKERGKEYGEFSSHACITMCLKEAIRDHVYNHGIKLAPDQWEALDMICHKIGRLVNGNPNNLDGWQDIAGYATLVADRLVEDSKPDPF